MKKVNLFPEEKPARKPRRKSSLTESNLEKLEYILEKGILVKLVNEREMAIHQVKMLRNWVFFHFFFLAFVYWQWDAYWIKYVLWIAVPISLFRLLYILIYRQVQKEAQEIYEKQAQENFKEWK